MDTSARYPTKTLAENGTFNKGGFPGCLHPGLRQGGDYHGQGGSVARARGDEDVDAREARGERGGGSRIQPSVSRVRLVLRLTLMFCRRRVLDSVQFRLDPGQFSRKLGGCHGIGLLGGLLHLVH